MVEDPGHWKPWAFGINDSHINSVTHVSIINNDISVDYKQIKHCAPLHKFIKFD